MYSCVPFDNLPKASAEFDSSLKAYECRDCENEECLFEENKSAEMSEMQLKEQDAIKEALFQQNKILYEQYAKEKHPKDSEKQIQLVQEMQHQYFMHYLSEIHPMQLMHQQQQLEQLNAIRSSRNAEATQSIGLSEEVLDTVQPLPLIPATLWTRKELSEFKREILKTQRECCIKIGSLSTAIVRVPTHPNGRAIVWEFATDHYDLGFGLFFEWNLEPQDSVTVNICESSDDEGEDDDDLTTPNPEMSSEEAVITNADLERGSVNSGPQMPTDELIPVYRRECHTEVYCGTHQYPGVGVYVFKFDNSFSLWRSKWLYYRIYYTP